LTHIVNRPKSRPKTGLETRRPSNDNNTKKSSPIPKEKQERLRNICASKKLTRVEKRRRLDESKATLVSFSSISNCTNVTEIINTNHIEEPTMPKKSDQQNTHYFEVEMKNCSSFSLLRFLENTGEQVFVINKAFRLGQDVYENIRAYADYAQEPEFEEFIKVLASEKARNLMGRMFKLERWVVINLFYFRVGRPDDSNAQRIIRRLLAQIWESMNFLANWIKELNIENGLNWVINDPQRIYVDAHLLRDELIESIIDGITVIISLLEKL